MSSCWTTTQAAQAAADELACFGWVQWTPRGTFVGEGRCSKATGNSGVIVCLCCPLGGVTRAERATILQNGVVFFVLRYTYTGVVDHAGYADIGDARLSGFNVQNGAILTPL